VAEFRSKIRAADALLIASPEYNYSVSGVLKNALDWGSRVELDEKPGSPSPFSGKALGMVSVAGRSGGIRSQLALRQIAVFLNLFPINKPEVIISNLPPNPAFDKEGNLLDQAALGFLRDHLVALRNYARQLKK
jgi:chromate reductase